MESIKIVLASPSDLSPERELIYNTIQRKDKLCKRSGITIDLRRWEDTVPGANKIGGQGKIDDDLDIAGADVFICMFWKKSGTVIDTLSETGTEHELNTAIESFKTIGKPDIVFLLKDENAVRDARISELKKKVSEIAIYKSFSSEQDLIGIIDDIVTEQCNRRLNKKNNVITNAEQVIKNTSELLKGIQNNSTLFIAPGFYDLLSGEVSSNVYYEEVHDGKELIIKGINNLELVGNSTKFIIEPRYAAVITFRNCSNIKLSNIIIGHTPHTGQCIGSVLRFDDCTNVTLSGVGLFGCGTYGIFSINTDGLQVKGSQIWGCSQGAIYSDNSEIVIYNSEVYDCKVDNTSLFEFRQSFGSLNNVYIHDNITNKNLFELTESNVFCTAVSIEQNSFAELGINCQYSVNNNKRLRKQYARIESSRKINDRDYNYIMGYLYNVSEIEECIYEEGKMLVVISAIDHDTLLAIRDFFSMDNRIKFVFLF